MRLDIPESVTEFAKKIPFFAEKQEVAVFELSDVISLNNRNYRVDADGESYLLRISNDFGKFLGIRRENETESARAAAEAGLGPEIFHSDASGTMVMEFIHGKHWSPEAFHDPVNLERLGTALSKLHAIKTVRADGSQFRTIERLLESARSLGVRLPPEIKEYQAKAERIEKMRLEVSQYSPGLTHNDFFGNNFLDDCGKLVLFDWEFSGHGDGMTDLASISICAHYSELEEIDLLKAYGLLQEEDFVSLQSMKWAVRLFEACWASVWHGLQLAGKAPISPEPNFNYQKHASDMFELLV